MKKKIIFVITSFEYYTSYLVTDALKKIKSKYNVYYYVSYEINKNLFRGIKNVTYYKTINKNIFLNQKIFDLNTNKYSKKFSSFLLRKKRFYGLNLNFDKNVSFFIKILKTVNRLIIFFYNELYFIVFKNDFLYNFYINYLNFFKIKDIPLSNSTFLISKQK